MASLSRSRRSATTNRCTYHYLNSSLFLFFFLPCRNLLFYIITNTHETKRKIIAARQPARRRRCGHISSAHLHHKSYTPLFLHCARSFWFIPPPAYLGSSRLPALYFDCFCLYNINIRAVNNIISHGRGGRFIISKQTRPWTYLLSLPHE